MDVTSNLPKVHVERFPTIFTILRFYNVHIVFQRNLWWAMPAKDSILSSRRIVASVTTGFDFEDWWTATKGSPKLIKSLYYDTKVRSRRILKVKSRTNANRTILWVGCVFTLPRWKFHRETIIRYYDVHREELSLSNDTRIWFSASERSERRHRNEQKRQRTPVEGYGR